MFQRSSGQHCLFFFHFTGCFTCRDSYIYICIIMYYYTYLGPFSSTCIKLTKAKHTHITLTWKSNKKWCLGLLGWIVFLLSLGKVQLAFCNDGDHYSTQHKQYTIKSIKYEGKSPNLHKFTIHLHSLIPRMFLVPKSVFFPAGNWWKLTPWVVMHPRLRGCQLMKRCVFFCMGVDLGVGTGNYG